MPTAVPPGAVPLAAVALPTTVSLPDEPSLEHLRKQAKDLRREVRAGEAEALAEVALRLPGGIPDPAEAASFQLSAAQLVVARRYGFASWVRLRRHLEVVERYSRFPDRIGAANDADLSDRFLRLACLTYEDDQPARWAEAGRLLLEHPELTSGQMAAAAAAADVPVLRQLLDQDRDAARTQGGPFRWDPLFYLAYARHAPEIDRDAVLDSARLLLEAGADPNAGYLWHGLPTPFTVLTGTFGEGELGPVRQPRHPHALALARLLLTAGADPNDAQTLYNRMFEPDNDHLELLFEFGLGTAGSGPWHLRLGHTLQSPGEMVRGQLTWAITHGMTERVLLLLDHGADVATPLPRGSSFTNRAATTGHPELMKTLVAHGAPPPKLSRSNRFVADALASDRAAVDRLLTAYPDVADRVRTARPGLVTWAAVAGGSSAVELLVDLGFDVNALGRTDTPSNQPWETALHHAAQQGDADLARTLLRLGAEPDIRDARFDATALSWAHHFGHEALVELLEPVTAPPANPPAATPPGP